MAQSGFDVVGLGRSRKAAETVDAAAQWIIRNIPTISVAEWRDILSGVDVVVNASGALQDRLLDDLEAIHVRAVSQLAQAAADLPVRIIQISAAGVSEQASTNFFRTKARGDAALRETMQNWVILRPTLILAPQAYGGTAMLRAAAAFPFVHPIVLPDAQIQTVCIDDVTAAVVSAASGKVPAGTTADLTEAEARDLCDLIAEIRTWQGWPPPPLLCTPAGFLRLGLGTDRRLAGVSWLALTTQNHCPAGSVGWCTWRPASVDARRRAALQVTEGYAPEPAIDTAGTAVCARISPTRPGISVAKS